MFVGSVFLRADELDPRALEPILIINGNLGAAPTFGAGIVFGHGKETLASILVTLNLLAFAFHTAARLAVHAWRKAVVARGATYRFFEHLRTVTAYVVFETWDHLLRSIEAAAVRPP